MRIIVTLLLLASVAHAQEPVRVHISHRDIDWSGNKPSIWLHCELENWQEDVRWLYPNNTLYIDTYLYDARGNEIWNSEHLERGTTARIPDGLGLCNIQRAFNTYPRNLPREAWGAKSISIRARYHPNIRVTKTTVRQITPYIPR